MAKKKAAEPEEGSAIELAIGAIEKAFGKGAVMFGKTQAIPEVEFRSSGCRSLDKILGGGWGKGRIIEAYGPPSSGKTTVSLHAIAETQKNGELAAFIDVEHAFDPAYATALNVDLERLVFSQPDSGEEALQIVEKLCGVVGLIVVDSVSALLPRAEIEKEIGDSVVGRQAILMSQAMRKLSPLAARTGTTLMFINQIRMKVNTFGYGCLHYDTLVNFTDGKGIPIGKVVDNKITGDVYCIGPQGIESRPIVDWHDNGVVEKSTDFVHIQSSSINGGGRFGITCTPNHKLLTQDGWKEAENLCYNDRLTSKYLETINGSYKQFLNGILIGDSHISIRSKNTASLRLQDNENINYVNWKLDQVHPFIQFTERKIERGYRYDSSYSFELAKIKKSLGNRDPMYMLNDYSHLSMAIWIMDDGHLDMNDGHQRYTLSVKRLRNNVDKLEEIKSKLTNLGFDCSYRLNDGAITFTKGASDVIACCISQYIPNCMQYKLPPEWRGRYQEPNLSNCPNYVTEEVEIRDIRFASPRQMRNKRKFDLTVEENHNYMVGGINNGIIVHNSPETTSGGEGLKFYCSQRVDVRRIGGVKEGEKVVANKTKIKVVKSKLYPPFGTTEVEIRYGTGIDFMADIIDEATKMKLISKSGAWYAYGDIKLGCGKPKAGEYLKENPDVYDKLIEEMNKNE